MAEEYYDEFNRAPPGHSLTGDNSKWPWGRPPQHVNPDAVFDMLVERLMEPRRKKELMKLLVVGVSVETLVEGMLFTQFQKGTFNPDVGLMMKGPLAIMISDMAEEEGIPYRLFENSGELDRDEMDAETFMRMMKDNNPQMFAYVRENLNAAIRAGNQARSAEPSFMTMERGEEDAE